MTIKNSLDKLDPTNDDHWTSDGLPRLDVLKKQSGNERLTRKQVTDADPSFSRASVLAAEAPDEADEFDAYIAGADAISEGDEPAIEGSDTARLEAEVMVEAVAPTGTETVAEAATPAEAPEIATPAPQTAVATPTLTKMEVLKASLAIHEKAMLDADAVKETADKAMKVSSDEVNAINRQIEVLTKADPHAATAGIRDYIAMQNQIRINRALRADQFMGKTGAKPGDVAKVLEVRSPLDKAYAGRKPPRGSQRPPTRA